MSKEEKLAKQDGDDGSDRHTDTQTDRHTDRQIDRQTRADKIFRNNGQEDPIQVVNHCEGIDVKAFINFTMVAMAMVCL